MVLSLFQNNLAKAVSDSFPGTVNFYYLLFNYNYFEINSLLAPAPPPGSKIFRFFEKYAKDNHFDPLVPENWYKIDKENLFSAPVCFELFFKFYLFHLLSIPCKF